MATAQAVKIRLSVLRIGVTGAHQCSPVLSLTAAELFRPHASFSRACRSAHGLATVAPGVQLKLVANSLELQQDPWTLQPFGGCGMENMRS